MLLKYFYDDRLAQASYMVGCAATGEALIVDPARDITSYIQAAENEGLRITHVTETHIHADFVSGARELAAATGATLYLSGAGDDYWQYQFADDDTVLVGDGDTWMVGNVKVEVLHTPGHTPEHLSFMITDTAASNIPMGVFTGDFLFVGDVGRPDLLEEAAGLVGTADSGARLQFHTVERFKSLPDHLQIWPGHGAGSACGKALGAIPSTTLGYEKMINPAFQFGDEDAFAAWLLDGQPEAPRYFAQMKKVNREGPALLSELPAPQALTDLDTLLAENAMVIDLRDKEQFAAAYRPGTLNIPASNTGFINYVGWFVDYEQPMYIIVPQNTNVAALLSVFRSIGIDNLPGYFTAQTVTNGPTESLTMVSPGDLAQKLPEVVVLDVRGKSEFEEKHIAGAQHIALGYLPRELDHIPHDRPIVTQCLTGYRSQIAASLLRRAGYDNVLNLSGGLTAWTDAALPTE